MAARIPEYPPQRTGDLQKDYDNLREFLMRLVQSVNQLEQSIEKSGSGGSSVTVDEQMDAHSNNPVRNAAITQALANKADASSLAGKANISDLANYMLKEGISISWKSGTISLQAHYFTTVSIDVAVSGYSAIGIVGRYFSVSELLFIYDYVNTPDNTANAMIWNTSDSSVTDATYMFAILYKKD